MVEKSVYVKERGEVLLLWTCNKERMKESGRRHAGRWRGVDAGRKCRNRLGRFAPGCTRGHQSLYGLRLACMGDRQLAPRVPKSERLSKHGPCPFRGKLNDGPSRIGMAASNGALIWGYPYCEWFGSSLGALREIALISHHPVHVFRASRAIDGKGWRR